MINKVYKFIVINKNNMKSLKHFHTAQMVYEFIRFANNNRYSDFIILKDENEIIDFETLKKIK